MYLKSIKFLPFILGLLMSLSCANKKLHKIDTTAIGERPKGLVTHTMFLIGDAGDAGKSNNKKAAQNTKVLNTHLKKANENSTIVFLGDNIYPVGLPPESESAEYLQAADNLDAQMKAVEGFKGYPIFIPGNHDWAKYRLKGLNRQEAYIETGLQKILKSKDEKYNFFVPDGGCSGPEILEINDQVVLMVIDSHWWLMDWDKEPEINKGCETQSREEMIGLVKAAFEKYKDRNIVIATHHPFRSYGSHGGYFSVKDHIFPGTMWKKYFYLPLPGLGTIFMRIRAAGVSRQDVNNKHNQALNKALVNAAKEQGEFIFVAGHEHNLQYIQDEGQHFVVSGSGSKTTAVAKGKKALFGYAKNGFSKIEFFEDGAVWIEFWVSDKDTEMGKKVFEGRMKKGFDN